MAPEPANGGVPEEPMTVVIRTFSSHADAELAAANLKARGIECWTSSND